MSGEVQVEGQVQVFGDTPGERGEGARVQHDVLSSSNGETELSVGLIHEKLPERGPHIRYPAFQNKRFNMLTYVNPCFQPLGCFFFIIFFF